MRVLHIGLGFSPWWGGGYMEYAEDLMQAQIKRGYDVHYFFSGRHYPFIKKPHLLHWRKNSVDMWEIINGPNVGINGTLFPEKQISNSVIENFLYRAVDKVKPDIVHIQEFAGLTASIIHIIKSRKIPIICTLEDYASLCPTIKLLNYKYQVCLKKYVGNDCRKCCKDSVRSNSSLIKLTIMYHLRWLKKYSFLFKVLKRFLYNPIIIRLFKNYKAIHCNDPINLPSKEDYQKRRNAFIEALNKIDILHAMSYRVKDIYNLLGARGKKSVVLHLTLNHLKYILPKKVKIGNIITFGTLNVGNRSKGLNVVLDTFINLYNKRIRNWKLIMYGGISQEFLPIISSLPSNIIVHRNSYDRNLLNDMLNKIDVGIVPSIWEEAFGFVGLEFLAKGIPVIGSNIGGIPDYVREGKTGWLFEKNNSYSLQNIIINIIKKPRQIENLNDFIVNNRKKIIKDMDKHCEEIEKLYKSLI